MKKIYYQFCKYAGLNILGMVFLSGYILADTFFVSKALGTQGLAALNFSISIFSILHATGLMLGIGGATKFAFYKVNEEHEKANKIFTVTMALGVFASLIYVFVGLFYTKGLASLLGADAEILELTVTYLKTILLFAPAFIANNILLAFVRNDHSPKLAMLGMITGSLLNIVLDYVFIFPWKMGIFGAALATCIAPIVSIGVLLLHFVFKKNTFKLQKAKVSIRATKEILSLGSSTFITELSSSIALIVFNLIIFKIKGNTGVAAYGIIANISLVVLAIFIGVAQGIQPLVSRSSGQGDLHSAKWIGRLAMMFCILLSAGIYSVSSIYANEIIGVFNSEGNTELMLLAERGIFIYFIGFFFAGINIISSAYLSAMRCPKPAFTISITRACVAILPLVIVLSLLFGMEGVWLSFILAEFITAVISVISTRKHLF